jgi:hypothetical protein
MKILLLANFLWLSGIVLAQPRIQPDSVHPQTVRSLYTIDIGFSGLQLASEQKIGKTQTVQVRTGFIPMVTTETDLYTGIKQIKGHIALSASGEIRQYYNFNHRLKKAKETRNNGANYFSLMALYTSKPLGSEDNPNLSAYFYTCLLWGFNRYLGDRFLFNLNLGPMYLKSFRQNSSQISFYGDLRWGFILNKEKQ